MSQGSYVAQVRIPPELEARMETQLISRNLRAYGAEWTYSDFIRAAIEEKLAHMERSRQPKRRKAKEPTYVG